MELSHYYCVSHVVGYSQMSLLQAASHQLAEGSPGCL